MGTIISLPVSASGYFFPFLRSGIEFLGVGKKVVRETPLQNPPGPKKYSATHPEIRIDKPTGPKKYSATHPRNPD